MEVNTPHPIISVIVPTYNRSMYITRTLESVRYQEYRPIEIIVVDDGSTDDTLDILNEYKLNHTENEFHIFIKSQENKGAPIARNVGLSLANGKYIQYLDSDDYIKKDKLSKQVKIAESTYADIVVCDYEREYENGNREYFSNKDPRSKVLHGGSIHIITLLICSKVAKKINWDPRLISNQDVDYNIRLMMYTDNVKYIKESLCIYYEHSGQRIGGGGGEINSARLIIANNIIKNYLYSLNIPKCNIGIYLTTKLIFINIFRHIKRLIYNKIINIVYNGTYNNN